MEAGHAPPSAQAFHRSGGGGERIGGEAEVVEHGHVEVGERVVALRIECEVLSVLEPSASEQHGEVHIGVRVGAPHAGAVEDHGVVQEIALGFFATG